MNPRFKQQLLFLTETDQLKNVERVNLIADGSRRENAAEHSWHLALMALLLHEYAGGDVNLLRVLKMTLAHDLVEVYAGDTFAYDTAANEDKTRREQQAAHRLFGLLPRDQGEELRALWEEFDAMETPDSQFAAAMDRLQPFLLNYLTQGHTWKLGEVSREQVLERMGVVQQGAPALWPFVQHVLGKAEEKGYLPATENE